MFLICILTPLQNIEHILCFIENHPVLVGITTSIIASMWWLHKYISQKRAEAFFGFYAKLYLRLKTLKTRLKEMNQLNISNDQNGNIYSLIYTEDVKKEICPGYKIPENDILNLFQSDAKELKNILLNTENNVYPSGIKQKEWYKNQHILILFCEFLENKGIWYKTNIEYDEGEHEYKHIKKCRILIDAMNQIEKAIINTKY